MSEERWTVLEDILQDEEHPNVSMDVDRVVYMIRALHFKHVIKESENPAEFKRMRDLFTVTLGQKLACDCFQIHV